MSHACTLDTYEGTNVISNPIGRVTRIDDNEFLVLLEFKTSDNSAHVSGSTITLSKLDTTITLPKGVYAFELETTLNGVRDRVFKNSFFIVE